MVWIQVLFFIITNAPSLIRSIRELIDAFDGDKKKARAVLREMRDANKVVRTSTATKVDVLKAIIDKHKNDIR